MRLVFWQNCMSPHQLPYITHLLDDSRVDEVVIAAGETINKARAKMGWDNNTYPGLERCNVLIAPCEEQIVALLHERVADSIHLFSGIRGFKFVYKVFKYSLSITDLRRSLITERPNTFAHGHANGKPLWLHWLRWKLQERKNIRQFESVFAMGYEAVNFYKSVSDRWDVFPFGYCTHNVSVSSALGADSAMTGCPRIMFVGSLSWRKSAATLLISTKLSKNRFQILFIGDGPERLKMERYVADNNMRSIEFLGFRKQSEVPALLADGDVLVLPSVYDGWGAVVNEALQAGLYVICSDRCGAKDLLIDERCGVVFKGGDVRQLTLCLDNVAKNIEKVRLHRQWRKEWAEHCISGKVMAEYMVDCLTGVNNGITPWSRNV